MKYCAKCQKELPTPLDEYGPFGNEVCQSDFLSGELEDAISEEDIDIDQEIEDAEERIGEIEAELEDLEDEKYELMMKLRHLQEALNERDHTVKKIPEPIDFSKYPIFAGMPK
jgi:hypothetical protein